MTAVARRISFEKCIVMEFVGFQLIVFVCFSDEV